MKIRPKGSSNIREVFCIYWFDEKRHYMSIDLNNFQGVDIYTESDSDIVDDSIDNFVMRKNSNQSDMLVHKALSEDDLLDRVIEWDTEAAEIFFIRLEKFISKTEKELIKAGKIEEK